MLDGGARRSLAWGVAGAVGCAWMAPLEPVLLEEGMLLHVAERLGHGERLFVDIVSFTGPLPFELLGLVFRLFGENLWLARALVALLHGVATAAAFALASRAAGARAGAAAAALLAAAPALLFPLLSIYFYTTLATALAWITAFAAWAGTRRAGAAFGAGLLIACVALTKQTLGVALLVTLVPAMALCQPPGQRLRRVAATASGGACVAAVTMLTYTALGSMGAMFEQLVLLPMSFGATFDLPFVNFWPPGRFTPELARLRDYYVPQLYWIATGTAGVAGPAVVLTTQLLFALPFVALAATLALRAAGPLPPPLLILTAALVALLTNLYPRTDWGHLVFVLPSSAVQAVVVAALIAQRAGPRTRRLVRGAAGLLVVALLVTTVVLGLVFRAIAGPSEFGPRVPLRSVSAPDAVLARVVDFVRTHAEPGEPIFVPRAEPLVYFATGTTNPTPYSGVVPGHREAQEKAILAGIEQVRFVVMSDLDQPVYTYYGDELPAVQAYLERHFEVAAPFRTVDQTWLVVLERQFDRGEVAVDLLKPGSGTRRWILDAEGRKPPPRRPPRLGARHNRRPLSFVLGAYGGGVAFNLEVPEGAIFEMDHGLSPMRSYRRFHHPVGARLVVSVGHEGELVSLATVDPTQERHEWGTLAVDLSPWAGRRVSLVVELRSSQPLEPRRRLAWLGSPRLRIAPTPP